MDNKKIMRQLCISPGKLATWSQEWYNHMYQFLICLKRLMGILCPLMIKSKNQGLKAELQADGPDAQYDAY